MNFIEYKYKDIGNIRSGKRLKKGYIVSEAKSNNKYIRVRDINNGIIDIDNVQYISDEAATHIARYRVAKGDIIISVVGTVGSVASIPNELDGAYLTENCNNLLVNEEICLKEYLKYYLQSKDGQNEIIAHIVGTTQPKLPIYGIEAFTIKIPDKNIQTKIIKILNTINTKIKLNTQTNNNLYEIGKALYQEYFENDKYTNNYEIKQLSEVTTNNRNKIDKSREYKVLSAVNTGNLVLSDDYFDKQVYSKDIRKYLNVNKNDFAYNPARINIGSIGLNTFDYNCCVSPVYVTFSVDKDYIDFFDFYFKSKKFNAEVTLRASGSVRQALNYNDFGMIEIPYPSKEMIDKFNNLYKTIKERINRNKVKINNLEQLRDTLLPKLMNGEIDLDKIEI